MQLAIQQLRSRVAGENPSSTGSTRTAVRYSTSTPVLPVLAAYQDWWGIRYAASTNFMVARGQNSTGASNKGWGGSGFPNDHAGSSICTSTGSESNSSSFVK